MTLEVVPYKAEHFYGIIPRSEQLSLWTDACVTNTPHALENVEGICTLFDGDEIICIAGFIPQKPGVTEAFTLMSQNFTKHIKFIIRWYRHELNTLQLHGDCHRIQAVGRADWKFIPRWMKAMGFEFEGLMRQWGTDKADYLMFGRTRNGN